MHTLTYQATIITLPRGLRWLDEYEWLPVTSEGKRALDGSLIVEASALPTGRPITLAGGEDHGWITKATADALRAQLATPGRQWTLDLDDGRSFAVMARPGQAQPFEARMLLPRGNPNASDYYVPTLRLMQV